MADTTITGLPNASALSGAERVPMDQSGTTVDAAASAIAALATAATVGLGSCNNTSDLNKPVSTATQTALDLKANANDARLSDSREWSAATATQAEAEAGSSTTRLAFTPQRVFQAVAAWWAASAAKTKLDGIATGATANSSDATLLARGNHTGTQAGTTVTGAYTAAGMTMATARVLGRTTASSGAVEEITVGTGLSLTAGTLTSTVSSADFLPTTFTASTITYAATVDLDMSALAGGYRTISLTGNLELTTLNRAAGRQVTLRLVCDATTRTLTFPAAWVFLGTKPSTLAASKTGVLSLSFFGVNNADCVAAYGVQA